jgi:hypothetical protein
MIGKHPMIKVNSNYKFNLAIKNSKSRDQEMEYSEN